MIFNFWKTIFLWRLFWSCHIFKLSSFLYKGKLLQIFFYMICGEVQPQEFFLIPLKHTIWNLEFGFSLSISTNKNRKIRHFFLQYLCFIMYEFILFWNCSGFFVCEDHILNTGGGLVSRGYLEEVWSGALTKENNHIKGAVDLILNDTAFEEGHVQLTTASFSPFLCSSKGQNGIVVNWLFFQIKGHLKWKLDSN